MELIPGIIHIPQKLELIKEYSHSKMHGINSIQRELIPLRWNLIPQDRNSDTRTVKVPPSTSTSVPPNMHRGATNHAHWRLLPRATVPSKTRRDTMHEHAKGRCTVTYALWDPFMQQVEFYLHLHSYCAGRRPAHHWPRHSSTPTRHSCGAEQRGAERRRMTEAP